MGTDILLERGRHEPLLILCEKPMAAPQCPEGCGQMVDATDDLTALVLYDFPELFDCLTRRIQEYLASYKDVHITEIHLWRSKDREDPAIPRNCKRMVTIQYQESVHCLAYILSILGGLRGSLQAVFDEGVSVRAEAEPYNAPNPEDYPFVVDGRCQYAIALGGTAVYGQTNFKAGAEWTKRRTITGTADGRPFRIEAEYLEGHKRLVIDGIDQQCDPAADSYEQAILTAQAWQENVGRRRLMAEVYPNPSFARVTYQLSSVLWRSSTDRRPIRLKSMREMIDFDARFREEIPRLPRYRT
jgi:predicted dehydrogenase